MKACLLLLIIFISLFVCAQQSNLRGEVSVMNSETFTGKRIYVMGAFVQDVGRKATPTTTDALGQFALIFVGVTDGSTVNFSVTQPKLEIVNKAALYAIAGQHDMVKIYMANTESFAKYSLQFYNLRKSSEEKYLNDSLKRTTLQIIALKKDALKNKRLIEQLDIENQSLLNKRNSVDQVAKDFQAKYDTVNLDDAPFIFKTALLAFQKGDTDSALHILENADLAGEVKKINEQGRELNSTQKQFSITKDSLLKNIVLKKDLHIASYQNDSVINDFKLLISADSTNADYVIDLANFLERLNRHDEALEMYKKAVKFSEQIPDDNMHKIIKFLTEARAYNNLGLLYESQNNLEQADSAYKQALDKRKRVAALDENVNVLVANTQNNLGLLYLKKHDVENAKQNLFDALKIRAAIAELNNSVINKIAVAKTYINLSVLYGSINKSSDSIPYYLNLALGIYHVMDTANRQLFEEDEAKVNNNLGVYYFSQDDVVNETKYLEKTLQLWQNIAAKNPEVYKADFATVLNNIGSFYAKADKLDKADALFKQALAIRTSLADAYPDIYTADVARTLNNLGNLYIQKKDIDSAVNFYNAALTMRRELYEQNAEVYEPELAKTLYNLADIFYNDQQRKQEAKTDYEEALKLYQHLAIANAAMYSPIVEAIKTKLATLDK